MIDKLTDQQEKQLIIHRDEWLDKIFKYKVLSDFNPQRLIQATKDLYKLCDLQEPEVLIAQSPRDAQRIANEFFNTENVRYDFSYYGNVSDYGWLSFYSFFAKEFDIINKDLIDKLNILINIVDSGTFMSIQLEGLCIPILPPSYIERDDNLQMHSIDGPAVKFQDGYSQYYIHGRFISEELFLKAKNGLLTRNEFMNEKNEDIRGAYFEILGAEGIMNLLGAVLIDSDVITHANGDIENLELYKTKEVLMELGNVPLMWVKFICPSTGTNYLIDVEPIYSSALEAAISTSPFYGGEIKEVADYIFDERA